MFSGPPGNLFSILTNVVFTSSFVYLCYNMCIFSHCVYKKSAKIINFFKTQKNPKKPNKTQKKPNPYPRKGQTGIGFFWVTPPPVVLHLVFGLKCIKQLFPRFICKSLLFMNLFTLISTSFAFSIRLCLLSPVIKMFLSSA